MSANTIRARVPTLAGCALALAALTCPAAAQETTKIGLILPRAVGEEGTTDAVHRAAQWAIDEANAAGGVDGRQIELVPAVATSPAEAKGAVEQLAELGAVAVIGPLDAELADKTRRAAKKDMACVSFGTTPEAIAAAIDHACADRLLVTRVGLVHDGDREGKALEKLLEKGGGLTLPTQLVASFQLNIKAKKLAKELAGNPIELLIVDGPPEEAAEFLATHWKGRRIETILTPRTVRTHALTEDFESMVILGQSPATWATPTPFRKAFEAKHGTPTYGVAEGYEAAQIVLRALDATDGGDGSDVAKALKGIVAEGARGRVTFDAKRGLAEPPMAVWRVKGAALTPYIPAAIPIAVAERGTQGTEKQPDTDFGEPLGSRRTRQFEVEPGTQWVICDWGLPGRQTIDDDLAQLGLSTQGEHPLIDRIVKDELMARILSITSTKFGRNPDGTAVPGKSIKISFSTFAPEKKRRIWPAHFAGDDSSAGGRAYGTYCEIYTSFIRRTIFQEHALRPALSETDLQYLDGTYVFGTDSLLDKRSELIKALINGYAGAMALTTAHEVGHLCGLGHITDDPTGIMNVNEGAGLDYRDANFSKGSWAKIVDKYGLSEAPDDKK